MQKGMPRHTRRHSAMSCAKRLKRSRCRLGYELEETKKHVLHGGHIGATWRIRLNRPCAAEMRAYVNLL